MVYNLTYSFAILGTPRHALSLSLPRLSGSFVPCFCYCPRHLKLKQSDHPGSLKQQRYPWRRSPFEIKQSVSALLTRLVFFFSSLLEETMSYDVMTRLLRSRSLRSVAVFAKGLPSFVCYHGKRTAGKWRRCGKNIGSIMILQVTKIFLATLCCPALSLTLPRHNGPEVKLLHARVDTNDGSLLIPLFPIIVPQLAILHTQNARKRDSCETLLSSGLW
jgi:hypothetical protein